MFFAGLFNRLWLKFRMFIRDVDHDYFMFKIFLKIRKQDQ